MNGIYQKMAVINRVGIGDGVDDGTDGANTGLHMEATENSFTGKFNAPSEPTLVLSIIFGLTAGCRHESVGIVDGLNDSSSRVHGRILRGGGVKNDEGECMGEKRTNAEQMNVVIVGISAWTTRRRQRVER